MLQLELGEELETRIADAAQRTGVSVDAYVRSHLTPQLPPPNTPIDPARLERQRQASKELLTFAKDRGIDVKLPPETRMRDYINEAMGW